MLPPLRPSTAAGDSADCSMKSSTRAMALRRRSRAAVVRCCGSAGAVSEIRFRSACNSRVDGFAMLSFSVPFLEIASVSCFFLNASFRHYQKIRSCFTHYPWGEVYLASQAMPDNWEKVQEIFFAAPDLPSAEQQRFL